MTPGTLNVVLAVTNTPIIGRMSRAAVPDDAGDDLQCGRECANRERDGLGERRESRLAGSRIEYR
jgi:hypothetical protein